MYYVYENYQILRILFPEIVRVTIMRGKQANAESDNGTRWLHCTGSRLKCLTAQAACDVILHIPCVPVWHFTSTTHTRPSF